LSVVTDALTVAVVGASGLAGREVVRLLADRRFPTGDIRVFGSVRTAGSAIEEGDFRANVALLAPHVFDGVDVAFFAAGPTVSGEFAPIASTAGAAVIDLSSRFRLDELVPLVVPEVNRDAIADWRERGIVANPSGTAIAMSVALAPILAEAGLRRVHVSTYQGVAGAGKRAVNGLSKETIGLLNGRGVRRTRFARRIAFNVIPQVGAIEPGGATTHELQAAEEARRVLGAADVALQITAVRVPVFFGLGLAINLETEREIAPEDVVELLRPAPGIMLHASEQDAYPTPIEVTGSEATHVGRVRRDPSAENGLSMWVSVDSIGKGAALNAVQIAEVLVRDHL
jgi:aspartate-semialdehyde dehydrogenase